MPSEPQAGSAPVVQPDPEDKDWTYVIESGCAECGFDPAYDVTTTGARLAASLPRWAEVLGRPEARIRPAPTTWSPTEYACHARDTFAIFRGRLQLMLTGDDARFANWDQDAAAIENRYWEQDPALVCRELVTQGELTAAAWDGIPAQAWDRIGTRSNGSVFTVRTFSIYFLHDVEHHLFHDVRG